MRSAAVSVTVFRRLRISAKLRLPLPSGKEKKPGLSNRWKITAAGWTLGRSIGSCWKTWYAPAPLTLLEEIVPNSSHRSNQPWRWVQRDKKIGSPAKCHYSATWIYHPAQNETDMQNRLPLGH